MKDPIIILHGWGSTMSGKRYLSAKKLLEQKGFVVYTPDLPGFGKNTLQKEQLYFDDYVAFIKSFLEKHKLKKVILIGHSFGGRIAIAFAALYPEYVSKLILVAASGIPHPLPSFKKRVVFVLTKISKPLFSLPVASRMYAYFRKLVYYSLGEMDYYKSGKLQKTFKNVYQVSIVDYLKKIKVPTCILWGENDTFVPVDDGKLMQKNISHSQLIVLAKEGHALPYENPQLFANEVLLFLK